MKTLVNVSLFLVVLTGCADPAPPPAFSDGFAIDGRSLRRFENHGDIWPVTWAGDGNLYTAGGDGDGWDGADTRGMDIDRLTLRSPEDDLASNGVELFSKPGVLPKGLISVEGVLYVLEQERGNGFARARIGRSTDYGRTWTYNGDGTTTWDYTEKFAANAHFINFGRDNEGARDRYVYLVGHEPRNGNRDSILDDDVVLIRAPSDSVQDISRHEYFSGSSEEPAWSTDPSDRTPVFVRAGEIHWGATISYNPPLGRYFLAFFTDEEGTLAVYDGPEPWGPWARVWEGRLVDSTEKHSVFFVNAPGWLSEDGRTWWFVTSGVSEWDSFNVLRATLAGVPARGEEDR